MAGFKPAHCGFEDAEVGAIHAKSFICSLLNFLFIITLMSNIGASPKSDLRLAIILLAAGEGSRMGSIPKALLKKDGKTLLENFFSEVRDLNPIELVVVTGFHNQAIDAELAKQSTLLSQSICVIHNPNPDRGQGSSVRLGLESLQSHFDVLAVCLCDQPNIRSRELMLLLERFTHQKTGHEMVMPQVGGQRGNPVLFSRKVVEAILSKPEMTCRTFMDQNPNLIHIFETTHDAFILDVDTEADIQKLRISK